jgi:hypothetical protein
VTLAPIKALACLYFFPPLAEKSKPPALRVVGDSHLFTLFHRNYFPYFTIRI